MSKLSPAPKRPQKRTKGQKIVCMHCRIGDPRRWWNQEYYRQHVLREHPQSEEAREMQS